MSNNTRIYGVIDVPKWRCWEGDLDENRTVLNELPGEGEWPWLMSGMFHVTLERLSYMSHLISFAAAMKGIEKRRQQWLEKLESLLRRMLWISVNLHLETEHVGKHRFQWIAKIPDGFSPAAEHHRRVGMPRLGGLCPRGFVHLR